MRESVKDTLGRSNRGSKKKVGRIVAYLKKCKKNEQTNIFFISHKKTLKRVYPLIIL